MSGTSSNRTRPIVAVRALSALWNDPDDLPKVFTVIESLSGRTPERLLARMRRSESGRRLLAAKPDLRARLADRAALRGLPEGTLGRAYAELMDREGITPQGIVDASIQGTQSDDVPEEDVLFNDERMRDTHDLWHVVTGYGADLLGESALLCFTFAQTKHPGVGFIALLALFRGAGIARSVMIEGYRRGQRAEWLPAVPWEDLLALPLTEVRERLGVGSPPSYEPVTTAALREKGVIAPKAVAA
jgi:ubiquinone biosynthesis protein COQ4